MAIKSSIKAYFPTLIYEGALVAEAQKQRKFLKDLENSSQKVFQSDTQGKKWSATHYPNGYTSYSSISNLHELNSSFINLKKKIDTHVAKYAQALGFAPRKLQMQSCWLNIMPPKATHSLHLHPLSVISGTFYVSVPKGSGALKFEDPRLSKMMAAPERRDKFASGSFARFAPRAGNVILFESWLRHEVENNTGVDERMSISFNYS